MIIASIDIGTNTVLLLIAKADKTTGNVDSIINEYRMPRLGKDLLPGQKILPDRIEKLYKILNEYQEIIRSHNAEKVIVTATNALRIASNSNIIVNEIKKRFEYEVDIIDGKTEAKYAFLGSIPVSYKDKNNLVIDIGGGSTELILGKNDNFSFLKSFPIGSVGATENFFQNNPVKKNDLEKLKNQLENIFNEIKSLPAPEITVAIAGTPTTLFCMSKGLNEYDDSAVEGSSLSREELSNLIGKISLLSSTQIKKNYGNVMRGREDIILAGAYILLNIMRLLNLPEVLVSSRGIRYGVIVNYINEIKK